MVKPFCTPKSNYFAIIPAAGIGQRFGKKLPKQYCKINDITVLEHSILRLAKNNNIDKIYIALNPDDKYFNKYINSELINQLLDANRLIKVTGGSTRFDSVYNCIKKIEEDNHISDTDWVLVHDAARPALHSADLEKLISNLQNEAVGGILAQQIYDTLKNFNINDMTIDLKQQPVSRERFVLALTPQMFRLKLLVNCYEKIKFKPELSKIITDDAGLIEYSGYVPKVVMADHLNPKLTIQADLALTEKLIGEV